MILIIIVFLIIAWSLYYQQRLDDERIDVVSIYQYKRKELNNDA